MPISDYLRNLRSRVGTELLLVPAVAAVIRDSAGGVLLQKRSDNGDWGLPGGALDPGEEPARAVVREVFEETGLVVRPLRLTGILGGAEYRIRYPNGDMAEPVVSVFECRAVGGTLECRDGESLELRYFPPGGFPPMVIPYPDCITAAGAADAPPYFHWDAAWLDGPHG